MREVTVYYAYDDTEFYTKEECLAYESKALVWLREIANAYTFWGVDKKLIPPKWGSGDIVFWLDWFDYVTENAEYIRRYKNLSQQAEEFLDYTDGFFIQNRDFNNELGFFKYGKDKWVKVGQAHFNFLLSWLPARYLT